MTERTDVAGVLLAGGLSRRMGGGDKNLRLLGGRTILERIIDAARPQVGPLVLNANGDPERFARFGLPVAADVVEGYAGPLAGVLTGLEWTRANAPGCAWVASFATDAPFLPGDLVERLLRAVEREGADMACARSDGQDHPVFGLWPVRLADDLRRAMTVEDIRKVDVWTGRHKLAVAEFATEPVDPFFNANRPEDLEEAERLLATGFAPRKPKDGPFGRVETIRLGVVMEKRRGATPWQDWVWRAVAVFPGAPPVEGEGRLLREGDGWRHIHAATLPLELFRTDTEGYKLNLSQTPPRVWVVLRPDGSGGMEPFFVTADAHESEAYQVGAEETVDVVPMPEELIPLVRDFVDQHHVDVPFHKRERKRHHAEKGGRRG